MQHNGVVKFIGKSPAVERALELCEMVAKQNVTVLLRGETGVGKELLARKIHNASKRGDKRFVIMNCPAITASISEAELFGHQKGSYTGAHQSGEGILAAAHGGTLFMDEVGDLDMSVQLKLLRFLNGGEELHREVRRVGSPNTTTVDVRIIAATNQRLLELVKEGRFRQDLYYRLNPFTIHIPALRTRPEDLEPLVAHFLKKDFPIDPAAMDKLRHHSWAGNVRELENVLRTAKMLACHRRHDRLLPDDIMFAEEIEDEDIGGKLSLA